MYISSIHLYIVNLSENLDQICKLNSSTVFLKLNSFPKLAVNVALQIESPYQFHHARCGAKYFKTVNSSEIKKDYINTYTMLVLVGRMLSMIN